MYFEQVQEKGDPSLLPKPRLKKFGSDWYENEIARYSRALSECQRLQKELVEYYPKIFIYLLSKIAGYQYYGIKNFQFQAQIEGEYGPWIHVNLEHTILADKEQRKRISRLASKRRQANKKIKKSKSKTKKRKMVKRK